MPDAGGSEVRRDRAPDAPAPSESAPAGRSGDSHYRPQLDGMRAVAVYLVVAFHAGISAFSGGFIGVDVFFVLSGYLVTQLLLRDFRAAGRIDFRRFYSRRFRRLLPAAFVALVVTAAVYTAVAAPADVHDAIGGFRSAFLYVANWHFISQSNDYFAANVNTNPVVHFWSLAVEEQFYLCWPLLLSGAYLVSRRAGERQWKVLRLIIAAGFVVSLVAALHLSTVNLSRAYYGTDTRAYELLAGALLAITPWVMRIARRRRRLVQASAPIALAALVGVATSTDPSRRDPARRRGHDRDLRADRRARGVEARRGSARAVDTERGVPRPGVVRHVPLALARDRHRDPAVPSRTRSRCSR